MLQPFLEVFAGLTLDQLLKGFSHGFVPGKLTNHYKLDFLFCFLFFSIGYLHRIVDQTVAAATKSGNGHQKTCKLPSDLDFLLFKFSCKISLLSLPET